MRISNGMKMFRIHTEKETEQNNSTEALFLFYNKEYLVILRWMHEKE
jgi:hypothetical protein